MSHNFDQLPKRLSEDLDRRLDHFDNVWSEGGTPDLEAYLPKSLRSHRIPQRPHWRRYVAELLSVDLEHRLQRAGGSPPPRIEDYFERIPWLPEDDLVLLELISSEFVQRRQRGDLVEVDEYRRRFPGLGDEMTSCLHDAETERVLEQPDPPTIESGDSTSPDQFTISDTETLDTNTPIESDTTTPEASGLSRNFGNYELQREIARGGMGIVYKAIQRSLKRVVALKVIRAGVFAQSEDIRRFHAEAEAAASLDHPYIVPIFEVGEQDGHHFFSMAYVKGPTLSALVADRPLEPKRAARILREVAEAIQYAHDHEVIHRDLKPSNIILEDSNTPRVTDFGLARQTNMETGMTVTGQVLGSPPYMPPEQALGHVERIDRRSDVYSLGATLYFLVTGRPPFNAANVLQTLTQVVKEDPLPPRRLNNLIPRDLENICLKCLNKSPDARYQSASDLRDDLDRFLSGIPTLARPVTSLERVYRYCRRKPYTAALLGSVFTLGVLLLGVSSIAWLITNDALQESEGRRLALQLSERQARQAQANAERAEERQRELRQEVESQLRIAEFNIYLNGLQRIQQLWHEGQIDEAVAVMDRLQTLSLFDEIRGWEFGYIKEMVRQEDRLIDAAHQREILDIDYSPDGSLVASAAYDRLIKLWDRQSGRLHHTLQGHQQGVRTAKFVDGDRLLSIGHDGTARLWNVQKGVVSRIVAEGLHDLATAAISPSGERWAWSNLAGQVAVYDLSSSQPSQRWETGGIAITAMAFDSTGERLAIASSGGITGILRADSESMSPVIPATDADLFALAFSGDGRWLAAGGEDGWVAVWDIETSQPVARWSAHEGAVYGIQFGDDRDRLLTCSEDQTIRLWSISDEAAVDILRGHRGNVFGVQMSPDGNEVLSGGADGTLRFWRPGQNHLTLKGLTDLEVVLPGSDGASVRYLADDKLVTTDFDPLTPEDAVDLPMPDVDSIHPVAGDQAALIVVAGKRLLVCDARGNTLHEWPDAQRRIRSVCCSTDGVLVACADGPRLRVFGIDNAQPLWEDAIDANVAEMCFTPDGDRLFVCDVYGAARLYEVAGGESRFEGPVSDRIQSVCTLPGLAILAIGDNDGVIHLHDADDLSKVAELRGHQQSVDSLAISPDGRRLASAGYDESVRVWDLEERQLLLTLDGHERPVAHVFWSDGGRSLISVDRSGTAIRWKANERR